MKSAIRRLLLGRDRHGYQWAMPPALAAALLLGTFAAYGNGLFAIQGGVVFVPGDAALVGLVAAGFVGFARDGLLAGWLVAYGPLLGYKAYHGFLGLSSRSLAARAAYFLEHEGLLVLAVEGLVVAVVAVPVGWACRLAVELFRERAGGSSVA